MSSPAAPSTAAADAVPPKKGMKKLLIIGSLVLLVLALAAGGLLFVLKQQRAAAELDDDEPAAEQSAKQDKEPEFDPTVVPTFVPLDMFTVNLADRDTERYAQVGITLEVADAKAGDRIKTYMPAIRNNILMVLSEKSARDLLEREGKQKLAIEVLRESLRPFGVEVGDDGKPVARRDDDTPSPIRRVHFSNFIIQ